MSVLVYVRSDVTTIASYRAIGAAGERRGGPFIVVMDGRITWPAPPSQQRRVKTSTLAPAPVPPTVAQAFAAAAKRPRQDAGDLGMPRGAQQQRVAQAARTAVEEEARQRKRAPAYTWPEHAVQRQRTQGAKSNTHYKEASG